MISDWAKRGAYGSSGGAPDRDLANAVYQARSAHDVLSTPEGEPRTETGASK